MNRRTTLFLLQSVLGAGLLAAWVWAVDLREVGETLRQARWGYVLLAAGLAIASTLIRANRWRLVLRPLAKVPGLDVWLISLASSLISFLVPLRTGELARALFLKQRNRIAISAALPTVAVDRSLDLLTVLVVGATGAASGLRIEGALRTPLLLGAALFVGFAAFVLLAILSQDRMMAIADRLLPRSLSSSIRDRILGVLRGLMIGFTTLGRQPRALFPLIALSFAATLIDSAVIYVLFLSLGSVVPPLIVLTGYALFAITFLVPSAPGYVGSMEAFGSLIFGALGAGATSAASMVVIFHALNAVLLGLGGGLAIWALGLRPQAAFQSVMDAEPPHPSPSSRGRR